MRSLVLAVAIGLIGATGALADEPVSTAQTRPPPAPSATPPAPLDPDGPDQDADGPTVVMGPCGPATVAGPGQKPDAKAHGQVDVAVGTRGYRHVRATVCKPIGQTGAVIVSVDDNSINYGGRRR